MSEDTFSDVAAQMNFFTGGLGAGFGLGAYGGAGGAGAGGAGGRILIIQKGGGGAGAGGAGGFGGGFGGIIIMINPFTPSF